MAGGGTAFYLLFLTKQRKDPSKPVLPSLRLLNGGGAPKPPEVFREVRAEMRIPVCHGYGMTECPMITQGWIDDDDEQLANTDGAPVHGCVVAGRRRRRQPVPPASPVRCGSAAHGGQGLHRSPALGPPRSAPTASSHR